MPSSAAAVLLLLMTQPSEATPSDIVVIERVLAVVDRRPVLMSEVRLLERLRGIQHQAALELLIDELLMYAEARRFAQAQPSAAEEQAATASLMRLRIADADAAELRRIARRQATILKYVNLRFRPLVRVSDDAMLQAYEHEYSAQPAAPTFAAVAVEIRERLAKQELDARVEEWTRRLRESASVDYLEGRPAAAR